MTEIENYDADSIHEALKDLGPKARDRKLDELIVESEHMLAEAGVDKGRIMFDLFGMDARLRAIFKIFSRKLGYTEEEMTEILKEIVIQCNHEAHQRYADVVQKMRIAELKGDAGMLLGPDGQPIQPPIKQ